MSDSNFFALKGKISRFCESCTIFDAYFLHPRKQKKIHKSYMGEPISNPISRNANIERIFMGLSEFDAEDVIDLSSPYKRTAERSSAAKKPHIKMRKPVEFFRRVSTFCSVFGILTKFELSFAWGFCSARIAKKRSDP